MFLKFLFFAILATAAGYFEWKNCDSKGKFIHLNKLSIAPSPLGLPGPVNVSTSVSINRYLPGTTKLRLKVMKKMLFWVRIPCIGGKGSCTYSNFCQMIRKLIFNKCSKTMEKTGVPCDCPFPTGTFNIPTQTIMITKKQLSQVTLPSFLVNGKYYIKAEFLDASNRPLGCFEFYIQLSISKKKKRSLEIKLLTNA